jgi:hypothetical protein
VNANIVYVAAAGGGIWKSTNATAASPSWTPLTDSLTDSNGNPIPEFMGAVAETEDGNGNQIVYAGTGEANNGGDNFYGVGILVSKNGGSTWTLTTANDAFNGQTVSKIVIEPSDPTGGTAYAAVADFGVNGNGTETGIWKTTNFGQTWTNTTGAVGLSTYDPWSDVVIDPHTPSTLYAAEGNPDGSSGNGVYKSTNGGSTWTLLSNCPHGTSDGRISLALYDNGTTNELFVSIANPSSGALYRMEESTNGGSTFSNLTNNSGLTNYLGSQGYYDTTLAVDPSNLQYVYAGGDMTNQGPTFSGSPLESFDGGATWHDIATDSAGNGPHTDAHAVAFDANGNLLEGDDGGIFRLNNPTSSSSQTWSDLNTNLNITQFYGIAADPTVNNVVYGGSQDNGTIKYTGSSGWNQIFGGDGGITRVDAANHDVIYQEYTDVYLQVSTDAGATLNLITSGIKYNTHSNGNPIVDFIAPYVLDASGNIYYGTDYLNFSSNQGSSWSQIGTPGTNNFNASDAAIDAVAVNPVANSNVVYVSAGGHMFVTQNAQAGGSSVTWTQIDLPGGAQSGSDVVHNTIAVDPSDPTGGTAYAVVNAFTGGSSGHVFKTTNFGATWTDISGNLPDTPVDSVAVSSDGKTVYVGTDVGVCSTTNGGTSWAKFGTGLPNAMVMEVEVVSSQDLLVVGTHGRGAWEATIPASTPAPITQPQQPTMSPTAAASSNPTPAPTIAPLAPNGYGIRGSSAPEQGDSIGINLTGTSVLQANAVNNLTAPSTTLSDSTVTATPAGTGTQSFVVSDTTSTTEMDSLISDLLIDDAEDGSSSLV